MATIPPEDRREQAHGTYFIWGSPHRPDLHMKPSATIYDSLAEYTLQGGRFLNLSGNGWFWAGAENPAFPGAYETRNFSNFGERMLTNG